MGDFKNGFGAPSDAGTEMGSIFDEPASAEPLHDPMLGAISPGAGGLHEMDPLPHDPMNGPLSQGFQWEQNAARTRAPSAEAALETERGQYEPALPANEEFLICTCGPCRHYGEWLDELDAVGTNLLTQVNRVCSGFGEPRVLGDEGTCFGCTHYSPPLLSLAGLRRWVISQHRLGVARRRLGRRAKLRPFEAVIEAIYSVVKGNAPELPRPPK